MRLQLAALVSGLAIAAAPAASAIVVDFDGDFGITLSAGQIMDDEYASEGILFSSSSGSNPVMVFDSGSPTGRDDDLGSPNEDFGGPGVGSGGEAGSAGQNDTALGNVLIISEDGDSSDPDDNARGGILSVTFLDVVTVNEVAILDIDDLDRGDSFLRFYDSANGLIAEIMVPELGNNSFQNIAAGYDGVARMDLALAGSGALAGFKYQPAIPEPASALLYPIGLAVFVGGIRRARRS